MKVKLTLDADDAAIVKKMYLNGELVDAGVIGLIETTDEEMTPDEDAFADLPEATATNASALNATLIHDQSKASGNNPTTESTMATQAGNPSASLDARAAELDARAARLDDRAAILDAQAKRFKLLFIGALITILIIILTLVGLIWAVLSRSHTANADLRETGQPQQAKNEPGQPRKELSDLDTLFIMTRRLRDEKQLSAAIADYWTMGLCTDAGTPWVVALHSGIYFEKTPSISKLNSLMPPVQRASVITISFELMRMEEARRHAAISDLCVTGVNANPTTPYLLGMRAFRINKEVGKTRRSVP